MAHDNANLAALIGSRICHDLISPIGAISNGLELLEMSGGPTGPEMDLIADSAGNAGARIAFFRIAYGAAGDQMLGRSEIRAILDPLTIGTRTMVDWTPLDPQPRTQVRLAFLALQCCENALPYGGRITISRTAESQAPDWHVAAGGPSVNIDEPTWTALNTGGAAPEVTPATVQFALLPSLLRDEGRVLRAEWNDTSVRVRF